MTETKEQRVERVHRWSSDRERCRTCGLRRINIAHEPDPENAPEGADYYASMRKTLHTFVPSGEYDPPNGALR